MATKPYIKNNRFWCHVSDVRVGLIKEFFVVELEESTVNNEYYEEVEQQVIKLYAIEKVKKDGKWVGLPMGRPDLIQKCLKKKSMFRKALDKNDHRVTRKMRKKVSFLWELRDYQPPAVKAMKKHGRGVLEAPPRSGKCVVEGTLVHTNHGLIPIEKMFSAKHQDGEVRELDDKSNLRVRTDTRGASGRVTHLFKKSVERTYELQTAQGRTLGGTPEHPVQILRPDMTLVWTPMSEINQGDVVVVELGNRMWPRDRGNLPRPKNIPGFYPRQCRPELAEMLAICGVSHVTQQPEKHEETVTLLVGERAKGCGGQTDKACVRFIELCQYLFKYSPTNVEKTNVVTIKKNIWRYLDNLDAFSTEVPPCVMAAHKYAQQRYLRSWMNLTAKYSDRTEGGYVEFCDDRGRLQQVQVMLTNFGSDSIVSECVVDPFAGIFEGWSLILPHYQYAQAFDSIKLEKMSNHNLYPIQPSEYNQDSPIIPYLGEYLRDRGLKWTWWERTVKYRTEVPRQRLSDLKAITDAWDINIDVADEEEAKLLEFSNHPMAFDVVREVKVKDEPATVYDLTVEGVHNFVANGIRVHNTVMATALTCALKQKTLIFAHQSDLIDQFYETFLEATDVKDVEKFNGTKICGICNKVEDFAKYDICLATYQMFLPQNGGKKKLKKVIDQFGVVIVDECFPAGTKILLSDGNYKNIDDFSGSEEVVSFNHDNNSLENKKVYDTMDKEVDYLFEIELGDGSTQQCSDNHRWWSVTRNRYVRADELLIGEELMTIEQDNLLVPH
ncbi:hypothetical protein GR11A_00006 [Vibrio phage vB_VcorM_GR11A]|nr:hypothetical protein GR11A_00006 [Vibrio phage vB_VcorM_GR11A]